MIEKFQILNYLEKVREQDAGQVASAFQISCETAGMRLLRLFRQGLVCREFDPNDRVYFYSLTNKGRQRLIYLESRADSLGGHHAKKS